MYVLLSIPIRSQGVWRIRHHEELYEMYTDIRLSTYIQMKNLRWAGHVMRMEDSCIPN